MKEGARVSDEQSAFVYSSSNDDVFLSVPYPCVTASVSTGPHVCARLGGLSLLRREADKADWNRCLISYISSPMTI
jgi:hypothetical protein